MNKNILFLGIIAILFVGIGISGCELQSLPANKPVDNNENMGMSPTQDMKKFESINEMKEYLDENKGSAADQFIYKGGVGLATRDVAMSESATAAPSANGVSGGSGDDDYSQTNNQVSGVDEPDFVKNDGEYIYMVVDNKLVIVSAQGDDSDIVSETKFPGNDDYPYGQPQARELFLDGDKVIVFIDDYEKTYYFDRYNIKPIESYKQNTKALLYDVSDRDDPELIEQYSISGYYYNSRLINGIVYAITTEGLYDWTYYDGPLVKYAGKSIRPEIYYFDNPENDYQLNTVTSISIDTKEVVDSESFMLGYGSTLMVSEDNIYIAYENHNFWCFGWRCMNGNYEDQQRERFTEVVVPLLEGDLKSGITAVLNKNLEEEDEWKEISDVLNAFYEQLKNDDDMKDRYEDMFNDIEDALNEYDAKQAMEDSMTTIHRIAINDGDIEYGAKGEVEGRLLNQFSMDEKDGNLRLATTVTYWLPDNNVQYNNVYVLNEAMETIGSLENIAKNESIYSARFAGDKLYLVTFRQIDPFFVIDLEDPSKPEVLGYLKIPGYSSYLHPLSENLILGVGQEVADNEWGGQSAKGTKVSLFDVTDFNNPKEIDSYVIGVEGTYTPVMHDHRAFLYIESKDLVVLPIMEVQERVKTGNDYSYSYRTKRWNGAYVLKVDSEGIDVEGKIEHSRSENDFYDSWFSTANVIRSLYINDDLYTISTRQIKVADLNDLDAKPSTVTLPYTEPQYYGYPEGKPMPVEADGGIGSSDSAVATTAAVTPEPAMVDE